MRVLLAREDGDLIGTTTVSGEIALKVDVVKTVGGGGGGGIQYVEGATTYPATGTAMLYRRFADSQLVIPSANDPLPVLIQGTVTSFLVNVAAAYFAAKDADTYVPAYHGGTLAAFIGADSPDPLIHLVKPSDPLPVTVISGGGYPIVGIKNVAGTTINPSTEDTLSAVKTSVEIVDDWDESDRAKVNLIVGQSGITAGAGTVAANTPRVTHASDDPVTASLSVIDDWDSSDSCKSVGNVAHDAADSGEPQKIGAKAKTSLTGITLVAADDRTDLYADADGVQIQKPLCPFGNILQNGGQTLTGTTSTAVTNLGAAANLYNYVTSISLWNYSSVDTFLKLQDGNGGTQFWVFPAPALGGCTLTFNVPLKQPTVNTALYMAEGATANGIIVSVQGFQSKL